jgi:hypothetical protein
VTNTEQQLSEAQVALSVAQRAEREAIINRVSAIVAQVQVTMLQVQDDLAAQRGEWQRDVAELRGRLDALAAAIGVQERGRDGRGQAGS